MKKRSLFLGWFVALISFSPAVLASADSLWLYSAKGSALSADGKRLDISGTVVIDGVVREWVSPFSPALPPSVTGLSTQNAFFISSFDLDIGSFDFYGGGPLSRANSIQFNAISSFPTLYGYSAPDTFLTGSGDFTQWYLFGGYPFLASDGTQLNVEQLFDVPPAIIQWPVPGPGISFSPSPAGELVPDQLQLTLERVAPIPEPEVYAMLGVGLALLGWVGRKRKKAGGAPA